MWERIGGWVVAASLVMTGCASYEGRYEQCGRSAFTDCLAVTPQRCDAMFVTAHAECRQQHTDNTVFENMPDTMRQGHLNRCLINSLVNQSGLPEADTKNCLRW